jgi:hypothetical protein
MTDRELIDALCIVNAGFRTEAQGVAYHKAQDLIREHAAEAYKRAEIKYLQDRLKELKDAK